MSLDRNLSKILIVDFGSQFTQLIVRRIRELGVFSELISHKEIKSSQIKSNIIAREASWGAAGSFFHDPVSSFFFCISQGRIPCIRGNKPLKSFHDNLKKESASHHTFAPVRGPRLKKTWENIGKLKRREDGGSRNHHQEGGRGVSCVIRSKQHPKF